MTDDNKTKNQLINELADLRQQVAELEARVSKDEKVIQKLQENETLYREIFETAPLGIGIADAEGNLLVFNDAMLEPGGYSHDDIRQIKNVTHLYSDISERDRIIKIARERGSVHRMEVQFKRKDGKPYDALLSLNPVPVEGRAGWLAILEDITERKKIEESLRLSEQQYRLLTENFPDSAIMLLDHDLRFVLVDGPEVEATGFSKKLLEGKTIYETLPPEFVQMVEPNILAALAGELFIAELPGVDDAFYLYSYVPLKNKTGEVLMAMILAQNITVRKNAERKLVEAEIQQERLQLLEDLINDLSHDIRTPLSIINTLLYLIKTQPESEKRQQYVERLESQIWQLDKLVESILIMARLDNSMELDHIPIHISSLLENIEDTYQRLIEKKQINLAFNISLGLPPIHGNEMELIRAIDNLMTNALTYTPDEGNVTIQAFAENKYVIIEIIDTGIGIDEAELPLIFERFYRTDKARSSSQGGTGLGLAIVKKVAERHGGKIEVESKLGEGSTFRMWIPASNNGHFR